jgi:hypothetical protein
MSIASILPISLCMKRIINRLLYLLYGLMAAEIRIVEGK